MEKIKVLRINGKEYSIQGEDGRTPQIQFELTENGHLWAIIDGGGMGNVHDLGNVKGDKGDDGSTPYIRFELQSDGHLHAFYQEHEGGMEFGTDLGKVKGSKGDDGYSPIRGTDYWTDEDIAEMKAHIEDNIESEREDIKTALNEIIAIQRELLGLFTVTLQRADSDGHIPVCFSTTSPITHDESCEVHTASSGEKHTIDVANTLYVWQYEYNYGITLEDADTGENIPMTEIGVVGDDGFCYSIEITRDTNIIVTVR